MHPTEKLIIFGSHGAHVETQPERIAKYRGRPNTLLNPVTEHMRGIPLSQWRLKEGKIIAHSDVKREPFLKPTSLTPGQHLPPQLVQATKWVPLLYAGIGALLMYLIWRLIP